jgi:hypothetical protein
MSNFVMGSFVRHKNRPEIPLLVVIDRVNGSHLLRTIPDENGNYEIIRGFTNDIIPILTKVEVQGKYNLIEPPKIGYIPKRPEQIQICGPK